MRELLLVVLAVGVLSLPLVTVLPAVAAGAAHLRYPSGAAGGPRALWRDFVAALRGVWPYALGSLALLVLLWFDVAAGDGGLAGGAGTQVFAWLVVAVLVVGLLRAAGDWRPGASWREVVRAGGRRAGDDLAGSALVLLAVGLCAVAVRAVPPLGVLVPGVLALVVVAVERRAVGAGSPR
ncbi:hypothetical protein [Cellulomonas wangsupingiae]|uniref:Poxvirus protein I5 n=1 Tax=Cellulomonas wangsupingiae TaxID=2968085 RepID=A0ABY5K2E5_9CELL|nr:hypothetical protein [Cellulomonas wangsupingiae]MCC2336148.1 hypothetical protein [Cellulomonas wangsupingiae]UUI64607.1 hypothetical protein NP075_16025 [Cellulomonas wangsupingiae]